VSRTGDPLGKLGLPYRLLTGVGGIGSGLFFALEGSHTSAETRAGLGGCWTSEITASCTSFCTMPPCCSGRTPRAILSLVLPIGRVGDDPIGLRLLGEMRRAGMDTRFVEPADGLPTLLSVCFQYPDGSGGNITTSGSAASALSTADVDRALEMVLSTGRSFLALAVPEVSLEVRHHFLKRAPPPAHSVPRPSRPRKSPVRSKAG